MSLHRLLYYIQHHEKKKILLSDYGILIWRFCTKCRNTKFLISWSLDTFKNCICILHGFLPKRQQISRDMDFLFNNSAKKINIYLFSMYVHCWKDTETLCDKKSASKIMCYKMTTLNNKTFDMIIEMKT